MSQTTNKALSATSVLKSWERHEAKYIISEEQATAIREYIQAFCIRDPHAEGELPCYTVTTLQLDSPSLELYHMKEDEAINRFKLRVRSYGLVAAGGNVYFEIKRKIKGVIVKSRARIPANQYNEQFIRDGKFPLHIRSAEERSSWYDFMRLREEIGADPVLLIRYERESYFGMNDRYARLTFDRKVSYRPTREWELWPEGGNWWSIDTQTGLNRPFSGVILELKTFDEVPMWMIELVKRFDLVRTGFCKYHTAIRMESLFTGASYTHGSESTVMD